MAELNERDAKLVQYLNEAYGKEKELETALEAHIGMTTRPPYKKRLRQHLTETRDHARQLQRRIKKLGGDVATPVATAQSAAAKALAAAKGPLHMVRGTGEDEKQLKNAKTEYSDEAEEIATYTAIEAVAESVGDKETARMARSIRRDEQRMAKYLERLIPQLSKAVVRSEVPSGQRSRRGGARRTRSSSSSRRGTSGRSRSKPSTSRRSSSTSRRSSSSSRRGTSGRSRSKPSSSRSRRSGGSRSSTTRGGARSSRSSSSGSRRSGGSRGGSRRGGGRRR